jgi:hypothetical protein
VALTLFLASVVQAVVAHRTLYQDGGHYLVALLETRRPTDWFWSRQYAQLLTQWPLALALRAGLTDLRACMTIQAAGLFYLTPLAALLGLRLAGGDRVLQSLVLIFVGAYYCNADFAIISESHVFAALVLLASVLLMRRTRLAPAGALALVVLAFLLTRCYESMVLSGVLLAFLCAARLRQGAVEGQAARALLLLAAVVFLAGVGIAMHEILHPVSAANREGFLGSLTSFRWVHSGVVFVVVAAAAFLLSVRRGLFGRAGDLLFVLAAAAYAAQPWFLPGTIIPGRHLAARVLTSLPLAVLMLVAFLAVQGKLRLREGHLRRALVYLLVVIIAQSVWHFGATRLWSQYVQSFQIALTRHEGFVLHQDIASELQHGGLFHWGWTEPTLSILLSQGGKVQAIFGNPALGWQPFDPTEPERLPKLGAYGVDYSAYLAALQQAKGAGRGPAPRIMVRR